MREEESAQMSWQPMVAEFKSTNVVQDYELARETYARVKSNFENRKRLYHEIAGDYHARKSMFDEDTLVMANMTKCHEERMGVKFTVIDDYIPHVYMYVTVKGYPVAVNEDWMITVVDYYHGGYPDCDREIMYVYKLDPRLESAIEYYKMIISYTRPNDVKLIRNHVVVPMYYSNFK